MAKTKTVKSPARKKSVSADMFHHNHEGWIGCGRGICFLCWIFKIMILVFLALLLFWLGFGLGAGSINAYGFKNALNGNHCAPGLCPPMSQTMSPTSMDSLMEGMTTALQGKTGADFDHEFLIQMIVHHEGAVAMAQQALQNASDPRIKELAQKIIDTQSAEIDQMKSWQQPTLNQ